MEEKWSGGPLARVGGTYDQVPTMRFKIRPVLQPATTRFTTPINTILTLRALQLVHVRSVKNMETADRWCLAHDVHAPASPRAPVPTMPCPRSLVAVRLRPTTHQAPPVHHQPWAPIQAPPSCNSLFSSHPSSIHHPSPPPLLPATIYTTRPLPRRRPPPHRSRSTITSSGLQLTFEFVQVPAASGRRRA